eukprot:3197321-Pleurochrysis_carterae.AAC.1
MSQQQDPRANNPSYVDVKDFKSVYAQLQPWMREMVARRWMKDQGKYWGEMKVLQDTWWRHFFSSCRQPAGRADGSRGSQQSFFEIDLPSAMCLSALGLG